MPGHGSDGQVWVGLDRQLHETGKILKLLHNSLVSKTVAHLDTFA